MQQCTLSLGCIPVANKIVCDSQTQFCITVELPNKVHLHVGQIRFFFKLICIITQSVWSTTFCWEEYHLYREVVLRFQRTTEFL